MQISLVTHFVCASHRALNYARVEESKACAQILRLEALMALDNALCCRGIGKALRLEINSIREEITKEMA